MKGEADIYELFPMLQAFEAAVRDDPGVLGVLYTGSLGRGTCDRFSDLDIKVRLSDESPGQRVERLQDLLTRLGEVHHALYHGDEGATALLGPEWRRTDLDLLLAKELAPQPFYKTARVIKDTDGILARLVAESPPEVVEATLEQAREVVEGICDSQIYLALHNARGAVWSAMGEVSYQCANVYTFLARLRGRNSYGFRYVEALLSPEEERLMAVAWPAAPTQDEVRRAARGLWGWTRHVWAEAERVLGQPLGVTIDEEGLLAAVDRIYTWQNRGEDRGRAGVER